MVLIALTPSTPPRNAARLGSVMRVTFGVIFAQTGFFAAVITQPQTSSTIPGFSPMAAPILRSGNPCGQEKFNSNESDARILTALHDFCPGVAIIFLHDRRDEHAIWKLIFAFLEFIEPDIEWAIANQFDVFP